MKSLFSLFPANSFTLIAVILAMPLIGAFVNGVFGRRLGKNAVRLMTLAAVGASFAAAILTFLALDSAVGASATEAMVDGHKVTHHGHVKLTWTAWEWMRPAWTVFDRQRQQMRDVAVPFELKFSVDALSGVMMLVVTGVGFLIHVYATEYMKKDDGYWRFFAYLNLFIFSMLVLILGDNLPVLFVGWEGVGLCSYLLIGFWYGHQPNAAAGKKAFVMNRIGDFGLLVAMALLLWYTEALDFDGIARGASSLVSGDPSKQVHLWPIGGGTFSDFMLGGLRIPLSKLQPSTPVTITAATAVSLALFLGATGKSAQLPLYTWLPDAMAGPTPVSALIHAATMVTAGIYLVCRMASVFVLSPAAMTIVAFTGAMTALLAAVIALTQNDIKKVLAYSTVSQLGFMVLAVGVGAFTAGFFHVFTHAFFKACLFLGAGSVIHAMHARVHDDERSQDMRNMGGLRKYMPLTFWTFAASTAAIIGFPLTSGFFSKDEILARVLVNQPAGVLAGRTPAWTPPGWVAWMLWGIAILAATLTAFYMVRCLIMTFLGDFRGWTIGRPSQLAKRPSHDEDADHDHHHDDLSQPGAPPHESPRSMTIPLLVLAAAAVVAGMFNPTAFKLFSHGFSFLPLDNWLDPVFTEPLTKVRGIDAHEAHTREVISTVAAFGAFAIGSYVAYQLYVVKERKLEAEYVVWTTRFASVLTGGVLLLAGVVPMLVFREFFTWSMFIPWALVLCGVLALYYATREPQWRFGFDWVYEKSVEPMSDALADTALSVDQGVVDFVIARLSAVLVAALGTVLRVVQTGVVHVYATVMVLGLALLGWFFVWPHADFTIDEKTNGDYVINAAPGPGYTFRWYPDGQKVQNEAFGPQEELKVHLDEGKAQTVKLEVKNAFGQTSTKTAELKRPAPEKEKPEKTTQNMQPPGGER